MARREERRILAFRQRFARLYLLFVRHMGLTEISTLTVHFIVQNKSKNDAGKLQKALDKEKIFVVQYSGHQSVALLNFLLLNCPCNRTTDR